MHVRGLHSYRPNPVFPSKTEAKAPPKLHYKVSPRRYVRLRRSTGAPLRVSLRRETKENPATFGVDLNGIDPSLVNSKR
jgi:hypothetical protein